jgi:hypothetical protein
MSTVRTCLFPLVIGIRCKGNAPKNEPTPAAGGPGVVPAERNLPIPAISRGTAMRLWILRPVDTDQPPSGFTRICCGA